MAEAAQKCPRCGSERAGEALGNLCPRCVGNLAFGAGSESGIAGRPSAGGGPSWPLNGVLGRRIGDYELLEEIARGGMGVVYKARQISLDRIVAVKMILAGEFARPVAVRRFQAEARAAAALQHPNIVRIHEVGVADGRHYFSMDLVPGRNLAEVIGEGLMAPEPAAACLKTIAEAVHYAHERGVLHRDLKPSNIVIGPSGQPHITDFGLAKRVDEEAGLTLTGEALGTPNFMPPEQATGKHGETVVASDIYSLGAILYLMLTGRPPFSGATPAETLAAVLHDEPKALRSLRADLPRELETICLKCLEKEC